MNPFILVLLSIFFNVGGQLCLKTGMQRIGHFDFVTANILPVGWQLATNGFFWLGITGYVCSMITWILVLSRLEISLAYPMVSLGYVIAALAGYYFFHEDLSAMRLSGILVIMFGVYLVSRTA